MIKAIIFDFGSVIYKGDWSKTVPEFKEKFGVEIGIEGKEKLIQMYNLSNVSSINFKDFLKEAGVKENDLEDALVVYKKLYAKNKILNKELLKLIKKLKTKYRVFGFTDIQEIHFDANEEAGFHKDFLEVFTSFKFKSLKSEAKSFDKLTIELRKHNLKPEECLFIDDQKANVENAKSRGFHTIQYLDFPEITNLQKELDKIL